MVGQQAAELRRAYGVDVRNCRLFGGSGGSSGSGGSGGSEDDGRTRREVKNCDETTVKDLSKGLGRCNDAEMAKATAAAEKKNLSAVCASLARIDRNCLATIWYSGCYTSSQFLQVEYLFAN